MKRGKSEEGKKSREKEGKGYVVCLVVLHVYLSPVVYCLSRCQIPVVYCETTNNCDVKVQWILLHSPSIEYYHHIHSIFTHVEYAYLCCFAIKVLKCKVKDKKLTE